MNYRLILCLSLMQGLCLASQPDLPATIEIARRALAESNDHAMEQSVRDLLTILHYRAVHENDQQLDHIIAWLADADLTVDFNYQTADWITRTMTTIEREAEWGETLHTILNQLEQ